MTKNEEIVRNAMQVIWNECDISRVGEFYSKDFKADYPHTNWGLGLEGICLLATQVHKDLPNYEENIFTTCFIYMHTVFCTKQKL